LTTTARLLATRWVSTYTISRCTCSLCIISIQIYILFIFHIQSLFYILTGLFAVRCLFPRSCLLDAHLWQQQSQNLVVIMIIKYFTHLSTRDSRGDWFGAWRLWAWPFQCYPWNFKTRNMGSPNRYPNFWLSRCCYNKIRT